MKACFRAGNVLQSQSKPILFKNLTVVSSAILKQQSNEAVSTGRHLFHYAKLSCSYFYFEFHFAQFYVQMAFIFSDANTKQAHRLHFKKFLLFTMRIQDNEKWKPLEEKLYQEHLNKPARFVTSSDIKSSMPHSLQNSQPNLIASQATLKKLLKQRRQLWTPCPGSNTKTRRKSTVLKKN